MSLPCCSHPWGGSAAARLDCTLPSKCAMKATTGGGSKQFLRQWLDAVLHTPQIFRRIAFRKRTLEEELQEVGVAQQRQPANAPQRRSRTRAVVSLRRPAPAHSPPARPRCRCARAGLAARLAAQGVQRLWPAVPGAGHRDWQRLGAAVGLDSTGVCRVRRGAAGQHPLRRRHRLIACLAGRARRVWHF